MDGNVAEKVEMRRLPEEVRFVRRHAVNEVDKLRFQILTIEQKLGVLVDARAIECANALLESSFKHQTLGWGQLDSDMPFHQFGDRTKLTVS
jgi:hypothetical protein